MAATFKSVQSVCDYERQLARFKADAVQLGLEDDYLFQSALERYSTQCEILLRLKKELDEVDSLQQIREYVKGSPSLFANPLLSEFYKASAAADRTCALLAKLKAAAEDRAGEIEDDDEL